MHPYFSTEYVVRHPIREDIPAITALLYTFDLAETGKADMFEEDEILSDWQPLNPETDAWVIVDMDNVLCGYATLTFKQKSGQFVEDGYVHPIHRGKGIGTALVTLMEARAAEMIATLADANSRLRLVNNIVISSATARALLEEQNYSLQRVFFQMHIDIETPPILPDVPMGIQVSCCDGSMADIRRAYETIEEGFEDHWDHTRRTFAEWWQKMQGLRFDPTLWLFAMDGEQMAGAALCRIRSEDHGWIELLAVRRQWRNRGLGATLLQSAFATFYQRGIKHIGLGVDSQSLTGAQRLYERAGMHITMPIGYYEKELRAGKDLAAKR
jgi:mycothiol synthase